jgi:hypothetical protein
MMTRDITSSDRPARRGARHEKIQT